MHDIVDVLLNVLFFGVVYFFELGSVQFGAVDQKLNVVLYEILVEEVLEKFVELFV